MNGRQREVAVFASGLATMGVGCVLAVVDVLFTVYTVRVVAICLLVIGLAITCCLAGFVLVRDLWRAAS